jgi:hypothetical protein
MKYGLKSIILNRILYISDHNQEERGFFTEFAKSSHQGQISFLLDKAM